MDDKEQRIRERAHEIWESEGRREGDDMAHWHRARQELGEPDVQEVNEQASRQFNEGDDKDGAATNLDITKARFGSPD
ncbi:MAG: DUF2934 domain-containing protein [Pseudomonadota bacterium]|nr:DUF2934 domain-containing protein [Pseudomonadota bacterium]